MSFAEHQQQYTQYLINQNEHKKKNSCHFDKKCGDDCILNEKESLDLMADNIKKTLEFLDTHESLPCEINSDGCQGEHECIASRFYKNVYAAAQTHSERLKAYEEKMKKDL